MVRKNNLLVLKFYLIFMWLCKCEFEKKNELLFLKIFRNDVIVIE